MKSAIKRATAVLDANRYFALATVDANGPWVATLAYTMVLPHYLYFFSEKTSRHGQALLNGGMIAGVIYDSCCAADEAESLQFSGFGEVAHTRETITQVLTVAATRNNQPSPTDKQISEALQNTSTLLFRVSVTEAFVLDQALYKSKGIDGREPVSTADLFARRT